MATFEPRKNSLKKTVLFIIFILGIVQGCSKNPVELQKKYLLDGKHYLEQGKYNEAIIEFQNLLKINPKSFEGRYLLGKAYLKKGWTVEGVLQLQESSKENPLYLPSLVSLAKYGVNSGQWTAVKPQIESILKIDPNNIEGLTMKGQRELALGERKKALSTLLKALSLSPKSVSTLVALGDLMREQNHMNKAKMYYQKALEENSNSSRGWTGLGFLAQSGQKYDEAESDFRRAIKVDPSNIRSRIILSNFMVLRGHISEAIALLKSVPKKAGDLRLIIKIAQFEILMGKNAKAVGILQPLERQKIEIPDIYLTLAKAFQGLGRRQESLDMIEHLQSLNRIPPIYKIGAAQIALSEGDSQTARNVLSSIESNANIPPNYWQIKGQIALSENNPERAIQIFQDGLKIYPENPFLELYLADALALKKNFKESLGILKALVLRDPKNPALLGRIGTILGKTKGPSTEINYFHEFSRKYPDVPGIEFFYLMSLTSDKKLLDAIKEAKKYLETHPSNQDIRFLMAQFELQNGHKNQAIKLYKTILASDPKNLQALHALADQKLAGKKFVEAESLYRQALIVQPDNILLSVGLGESLLGENQKEEAIKSFNKVLSLNPNQPVALLEISRSEILAGKTHQALAHLAPLLKLKFPAPQKAEIYWLCGVASEGENDFKTAVDSFQKATTLDSGNPIYHLSLGELYSSLSQWNKALVELNKTLSIQPKNALVSLTRDWVSANRIQTPLDKEKLLKVVSEAESYQKSHEGDLASGLIEAKADLLLNNNGGAKAAFERVLAKNPENPTAILGKARILLAENKTLEAKSLVEDLLSHHPENIQGNLVMASIDFKSGNLNGEIHRLEKIYQAHPNWVQPSLALATADLSMGQFEEAKSVSFRLYESNPNLIFALYIKANSEMGLKDYRNAIKDFRTVVKSIKNQGHVYNLMSIAEMKLGNIDVAKKFLLIALKDSPDDPLILNNMAFFMAENSKNLSMALGFAKKAEKISPQPFIQDTVGYVLFQMGRYGQAEPYFETAYKAKFRDPEFLYHMGLNERKLGKKNKSYDLLQKAVDSGKLTKKEIINAQKFLKTL